MCRLFGFRSVIQSQVHSSLVQAENALGTQSLDHPDGWGVCYYQMNAPHVIKSEKAALSDGIFKKISGIVSSQTVLAHIRKATLGQVNILNTHPFQFGQWSFAHNGNIKNFEHKKEELLQNISPQFRRFILGSTDSEVIFYFLLSNIAQEVDISSKSIKIEETLKAIKLAVKDLVSIIGNICVEKNCAPTENYLTFILTNGQIMVGHCAGKQLYYSTYKNKCNDSETCPSFSPECENATTTGFINHLIFTSEPLSGENVWIQMKDFELIGVDSKMKLTILKD